jgi:hypothetical protein
MHTLESCATASALAREPIAGTATASMTQWLVIENCGPWPRKGLPESMRADLRVAAQAAARAVPGTRLLLARGENAPGEAGPRIWIVRASAAERAAHMVRLAPGQSAEDLDLEARLRGQRAEGQPVEHLLLVCTHGQRDRCCAREGMPVYRALRAIAPDATLRASHLGGHRFAPTVVALPLGAHFGRVQPHDAADLVAAVQAGVRGPARWYRGRCFEGRPAQAALCHLHDALQEPRLDALTVEGVEMLGEQDAVVTVRHGDAEHRVRVGMRPHPTPLPKSCGEAPVAVPGWRVVGA